MNDLGQISLSIRRSSRGESVSPETQTSDIGGFGAKASEPEPLANDQIAATSSAIGSVAVVSNVSIPVSSLGYAFRPRWRKPSQPMMAPTGAITMAPTPL